MNKPKLILGVDPGLSGAVAVVEFESKFCKLIATYDMPILLSKTGKRSINLPSIAIAMGAHTKEVAFAMVEEVGVMGAKDGNRSMFTFGRAFGSILGILAADMVPTYFVKPAVWKGSLGLSSNKDESRALAVKMFPHSAEFFKRKKDDGRAEAALLCVFGFRQLGFRGQT